MQVHEKYQCPAFRADLMRQLIVLHTRAEDMPEEAKQGLEEGAEPKFGLNIMPWIEFVPQRYHTIVFGIANHIAPRLCPWDGPEQLKEEFIVSLLKNLDSWYDHHRKSNPEWFITSEMDRAN